MKFFCMLALMSCISIGDSFTVNIRDFAKEPTVKKENAKHWALIVAGSNTWDNYRHQADVCHAYQVLHKHGIPDEQIVVMMYDDIALNEANPRKGAILNHPKGPNVYNGVPKDYTGKEVTPDNFLAALSGDKTALSGVGSGKVIDSGPNDHIFVFFSDHGAPGLVAFPYDELHANTLLNTLKAMKEKNQFKKLVFYLEACESGSMFANLPKDIGIYATTAANGHESSYACYYDNYFGTYLGDVYSVKWMEDSDVEDLASETLMHQFQLVKQETNTSHVRQFGDKSINSESVIMYQGQDNVQPKPVAKLPAVPLNAVPSPEVPMAILQNKLMVSKTQNETTQIQQQIKDMKKHQDKINLTVEKIVKAVVSDSDSVDRILVTRETPIKTWECYGPVAKLFSNRCFKLGQNPHAMTKMHVFVNLCEEGFKLEDIVAAMNANC